LVDAYRKRAKAGKLPDNRKNYCFDLDVREDVEDEEPDAHKYTVDSYASGLVISVCVPCRS